MFLWNTSHFRHFRTFSHPIPVPEIDMSEIAVGLGRWNRETPLRWRFRGERSPCCGRWPRKSPTDTPWGWSREAKYIIIISKYGQIITVYIKVYMNHQRWSLRYLFVDWVSKGTPFFFGAFEFRGTAPESHLSGDPDMLWEDCGTFRYLMLNIQW